MINRIALNNNQCYETLSELFAYCFKEFHDLLREDIVEKFESDKRLSGDVGAVSKQKIRVEETVYAKGSLL